MDLAEENYNNSEISDIISNILTLRYVPSQNSSIPELTWKDFTPNDNIISEVIIEEKILKLVRNRCGCCAGRARADGDGGGS